MTIESALYSHLSTKASITALVSTRIYPQVAPESATYPFITYTVLSESHDHSMGGATGLTNPTIQIDAWADTIANRVAVSEAIRNALDGFTGNMGTENLSIRNCFLQNRANFNENTTEGKTPTWRSSMDFSIWHVESVPTL
jgi:hypothetical protein